jgi:hypothetical protein
MKYTQDFCCVAARSTATQQTVLNALAKRYQAPVVTPILESRTTNRKPVTLAKDRLANPKSKIENWD